MVLAIMDMDIDMAMEDMDIEDMGIMERGPPNQQLNQQQMLMLMLKPGILPMAMDMDMDIDMEVMDIGMEDMDIMERDLLSQQLNQMLMLMLMLMPGILPMDMDMDMVWATMDMDIDMAMEVMDIDMEDMDITERDLLMPSLWPTQMLRLMPIPGIPPMDMVLDTMVDTDIMDIQHTGHTMEDMEDMDIGEEKRGPLMLNLSQLLMLRLMPILGIPMDMVLDTMVDTEVMDIQHTGHTMEDMEDMDIGEERRDPLTLNLSQLLMLMLNLGTLPMDMVLDMLMVDMADGVDMVDTVDMADTVVGTTMESNSITYQKLRLQDLSLTTLL